MIKEIKKIIDEHGRIAYHYTSYETAINIINSQEFWLTKHTTKNDPDEISFGLQQIKNYIIHNTPSISALIKPYLEDFTNFNDYFVYLGSFIKNGDYLPAWRYYAKDGQGVAFGFHEEVEKDIYEQTQLRLASCDVIYDIIEIQDFIEKVFSQLNNKTNELQAEEFIQNYLYCLLMLPPMFKNYDYKDELEWRLCAIRMAQNAPKHITFPIKNVLQKIVLGPNICCTKENELRTLLTEKEYDLEKIEIVKSNKQFRTTT